MIIRLALAFVQSCTVQMEDRPLRQCSGMSLEQTAGLGYGLRVNYLPERRSDFSGPTEAATVWLRAIKGLRARDKPLATLIALIAIVLAAARKVRASLVRRLG